MLYRVTDVKQAAYCPRIVFYTYVLPVGKRPTRKMDFGTVAHEQVERLEARRTLARYGLKGAERVWGVWLTSERMGLSGRLDLLLKLPALPGSDAPRYVPVDFKRTAGPVYQNHHLQLAAYALLVEEHYGQVVTTGFIYRIPEGRPEVVAIEDGLKRRVREMVAEIDAMVQAERMPPPTPHRGRCQDCEFQNYCADIW